MASALDTSSVIPLSPQNLSTPIDSVVEKICERIHDTSDSDSDECSEEILKDENDDESHECKIQKSTSILKEWMMCSENFIHPYPTTKEKKELINKTGLSSIQLKNWFTNARRRTWRPLMRNILKNIDLEPILESSRSKQKHAGNPNNNAGRVKSVVKNSTEILRRWILSSENFVHPYPTPAQRQSLAEQTNLTPNQIKNWFTNARRRIWKPLMRKIFDDMNLRPILEAANTKLQPTLDTPRQRSSINTEAVANYFETVQTPIEKSDSKDHFSANVSSSYSLDVLSEVCSRSIQNDAALIKDENCLKEKANEDAHASAKLATTDSSRALSTTDQFLPQSVVGYRNPASAVPLPHSLQAINVFAYADQFEGYLPTKYWYSYPGFAPQFFFPPYLGGPFGQYPYLGEPSTP